MASGSTTDGDAATPEPGGTPGGGGAALRGEAEGAPRPTWSLVPSADRDPEAEAAPPPAIAPPPQTETLVAGPPEAGATHAWTPQRARGGVPPPPSSKAPVRAAPDPAAQRQAPPPAGGEGDLAEVSPHQATEAPHLLLPHARRLRRSRPTDMPPPPAERYDVPEDAAGRVRYVDQPPAVEHPGAALQAAAPIRPAPIPRADEIAGWIAVAALAAVLVVVFVIGITVTS